MSDVTPGRRRLGRGLVVTAATLALPLTASISYSVAQAQEPVAPVPPVPAEAPVQPVTPIDPDAPEAPAVPEAGSQREVRTFVLRREGEDGEPVVRHFSFSRPGPSPNVPMPPIPRMEFHAWGDPTDPDFEKKMEAWEEQMEKWGEEFGRQWEQWGEQQGEQALAWSEAARRNAPEVVHSCNENEPRVTADGRTRVVICQREIERRAYAGAQAGLRGARAAIANNRAIDDNVRREILEDLDEEIARIERDTD